MDVIIIEDELLAQEKMAMMLAKLDSSISIKAQLGSVKGTIDWLAHNPSPDLAFVDIQLSDDHSFEIFRKHSIQFPVIFTTAFDKYLLESFEFNSIDYLLKPVTEERLKKTLEKVRSLREHFVQGNLLKILNHIQSPTAIRILGKKGTEFVALDVDDIAYFFTEHKIVFARDFKERQFIVDKTLAELEDMTESRLFFRLNRKYLCSLAAIEKFKSESGKIKIHLQPDSKEEVFVSKETAPAFRSWIS